MSYQITIGHDGLHKHRVIRSRDPAEAEAKARAQIAAWEEQWERKLAAEEKRLHREAERRKAEEHLELKRWEAERITGEAHELRAQFEGILARTLDIDDTVDWRSLRDCRDFPEPEPSKPAPPERPSKPERQVPAKSMTHIGKLRRLWEVCFPSYEQARLEREEWEHAARLRAADQAYKEAVARYNEGAKQYNETVRRDQTRYQAELVAWHERKADFLKKQEQHNREVDEAKHRWLAADPAAITEYCELVLQNSNYPEIFPGDFDLEFNPENGILIVELELPTPDRVSRTKSAQYVAARDEIKVTEYKPAEYQRLYDNMVYQVALRTIHELYEADKVGALRSVVFNGRTNSIDAGTGQPTSACILSVQTNREEFLQIDLAKVDPAKCIRKLKGVSATTLTELTPVAPLLSINREDARFVEGREVITNISGGDNLAAMDWQQFEHLIRELFEREFAVNGGEVKVTRASRDGGVDAVIFDPDPIRGGKYVVQAKRYTANVPVSAVRDLYGTVVNEGAVKGILVTTAFYGPDSYSFAKDKPLTLLDGSNLLSMLQKHGTQAHIDLAAAHKILGAESISAG